MRAAKTYSTSETARLTGLTYRQIDYWIRSGMLDPYERAKGSGTSRRFSQSDVDRLRELRKNVDRWDREARALGFGGVIPIVAQRVARAS